LPVLHRFLHQASSGFRKLEITATSGFRKLFEDCTNGFKENQPKLESVFKEAVIKKILISQDYEVKTCKNNNYSSREKKVQV
jgi:hypothetical protein